VTFAVVLQTVFRDRVCERRWPHVSHAEKATSTWGGGQILLCRDLSCSQLSSW